MATEQVANSAQTTLAAAMGAGDLTLNVLSSSLFPTGNLFRIRIDNELMLVTAVSGTTWTVTRAIESTTAAAHSSGAAVTQVLTAAVVNALIAPLVSSQLANTVLAGPASGVAAVPAFRALATVDLPIGTFGAKIPLLSTANLWSGAQTFLNVSGIQIQDVSGAYTVGLVIGSTITANRTFTVATGDASRTLTLTGNASISGLNTGDQTITLTGDISGSGTGSFAATIGTGAVTYTKMQATSAASVLLGRGSASGAGSVQEIGLGSGLAMSGTTLSATAAGVPTGALMAFAGTSAPSGWLGCDGSAVSRTTYANLFSVIGTTWGAGDGSTTFNVPNFQRRVAVGSGGTGTGTLGNAVGNTGGEETHTLTTAEMPSHSHGLPNGHNDQSFASWSGCQMNQSVYDYSTPTSATGGGGAHNNLQPSAVVLMCVKT